jgi:hypothetical protein
VAEQFAEKLAFDLTGRGFKPRPKCHKINTGFSR